MKFEPVEVDMILLEYVEVANPLNLLHPGSLFPE